MRYSEIHDRSKLSLVEATLKCVEAMQTQLGLMEDNSTKYAVSALTKLQGIAGYLVKTELKQPGDLERFNQFLVLVKAEVPKLTQAFDQMKLDMDHVTTLNQRHDVFFQPPK